MAENVKQLQLQAAHMDRMSAVGQLAGGVAHEINNPLTAVLGQAQILLAKLAPTDPAHAQIAKIENAALRCKKIVRGLLDFSRPSQAAFEEIDANSVLASTLDLCEADLKKVEMMKFGYDDLLLYSDHTSGGNPLGANERIGVTDPSGRVFGTENLYVSDSSLFPSAAGINPSWTIMALSRRVALGLAAAK